MLFYTPKQIGFVQLDLNDQFLYKTCCDGVWHKNLLTINVSHPDFFGVTHVVSGPHVLHYKTHLSCSESWFLSSFLFVPLLSTQ
jgi:hypothetical protein